MMGFFKVYWWLMLVFGSILMWTSDKGDRYHTIAVISMAVMTIRHEEFF